MSNCLYFISFSVEKTACKILKMKLLVVLLEIFSIGIVLAAPRQPNLISVNDSNLEKVGSLEHARSLIYVFPFKFKPRNLGDDFQDFLDILPLADIIEIIETHLQTDGAFVDVINYLKGDKWHEALQTIESIPAVQDLFLFLDNDGFPVENLLAFVDRIILNSIPGTDPNPDGSLRSLLDEIEDTLPVDILISTINDKLQSSTDFQQLYLKLSSDNAKTLFEEIGAIDEVQRIGQRLRDMDVQIDEVLDAISSFLGWNKLD